MQQGMLYVTCHICQRQKTDILCGIFSIFWSANKATLKTACFPRTCKQPVCALGNRLINPQQIVPM